MTRFTAAAAAMQTLSLAAMEEASRLGIRDADVEHLFLALTLDAGTGGQVLRGLGIALPAARDAVAQERTSHLRALGIDADAPDDERISFHETNGYEWTDRAVKVLAEASAGGGPGGSAAVLRAAVDEPSGTIAALLRRLHVEPDDVRARLDAADGIRPAAPGAPRTGRGSLTAFVPAAPADVWRVVSGAPRISDWDPSVAHVDAATDGSDEWEGRAPTTTPEGKPVRIRSELRRIRIHASRVDAPFGVTWRMSYPDSPSANTRIVSFDLEAAAGGTQVRIALAWERAAGRRRTILGWLLRPLARLMIFIQLTQISSGLSRVFR